MMADTIGPMPKRRSKLETYIKKGGKHTPPRESRIKHRKALQKFKMDIARRERDLKKLEGRWKRDRDPKDFAAIKKARNKIDTILSREEQRINPGDIPGGPGPVFEKHKRKPLKAEDNPFSKSYKKPQFPKRETLKQHLSKRKKGGKVWAGNDFVREVNNYKEI